jgi:PPM family protein phosphatase
MTATPYFIFGIGKRENMEDSIFPAPGCATINDRLFIVCDGMGGHARGEVASNLACETFSRLLSHDGNLITEDILRDTFSKVQDEIDRYIAAHPEAKGMGTTIVLAALTNLTNITSPADNENSLIVMHCGDSRLYHIRNSEILFKTTDHSLVYQWVQQGRLSEKDADRHSMSNIITAAIQGKNVNDSKPDIHVITNLHNGDYIFMGSDGIRESVSSEKLCEILGSTLPDEEKIKAISDLCEEHSRDNFSAYLLKME